RNTWSWGREMDRPGLEVISAPRPKIDVIETNHHALGRYQLYCEGAGDVLFTENESNAERLWNLPNARPFVKDSISDRIVHDNVNIVNRARRGTKASPHYKFIIPPNESRSIRLRLTKIDN